MTSKKTEPAAIAPEDFDLDAALAGIVTQTRRVSVPTRGDLATEYAELERERVALERAGTTDVGIADRTVGDVESEMADLAREWEASALPFVLREVTPKVAKQIREKHADKKGNLEGEAFAEWLRDTIVAATVTPSGLTRASLDALEERVGQVAFSELATGYMGLSGSKPAISVPFSRKSSRAPEGDRLD